MNSALPWIAAIAAYLIGSLSFAVIVSSAMGLNDPRTYGSGNPGATNVLRSGSKAAAALTLLLDAVKGLIPVLLVKYCGADYGLHEGTLALVAIAAFVGHLFPVFFKFKGGKGVATALGVLLGISGWLGLFVLLTWLDPTLSNLSEVSGALSHAIKGLAVESVGTSNDSMLCSDNVHYGAKFNLITI